MTDEPEIRHEPVLVTPVLECFSGLDDGVIVDCTVGLGGHSLAILESINNACIIGLDSDLANLALAGARLAKFEGRVRLRQANFATIAHVLSDMGERAVVGVLADLGVSSNQIADPARGLSFETDGPLDMRLDSSLPTTAAELVNTLSEGELSDLLYLQSQERHSRRIAKRICQTRRQSRIRSTLQLARLVASAVGENPDAPRGKIHPATRTFMALRMAVNREEASLRGLLASLPSVLAPGGRAAIISFHSGEDRLVKEDFKMKAAEGVYRLLTKKPIVAEKDEARVNPRSRSAKLRIAQRQMTP